MQNIIAKYMRRGGHSCITLDDGVDGIMVLRNNPVDLIILDIGTKWWGQTPFTFSLAVLVLLPFEHNLNNVYLLQNGESITSFDSQGGVTAAGPCVAVNTCERNHLYL